MTFSLRNSRELFEYIHLAYGMKAFLFRVQTNLSSSVAFFPLFVLHDNMVNFNTEGHSSKPAYMDRS